MRTLPPAYFLGLVSKAVLGNNNGVQAFVHVGLAEEAGAHMIPLGNLFGIMRKRILGASLEELTIWRQVFEAFPGLFIREHYREDIDDFLALIAEREAQKQTGSQAAGTIGSDLQRAVADLGIGVQSKER